VTPTWITLREYSSMTKKAKSERNNKSMTGRRVTSPDLLSMIVQEGRPDLSPWPSRAHLPHVFLNGSAGRREDRA
jgi:hypothetical protein